MANGDINMKTALFETLNASLSNDTVVRQNAEQQIKAFEVTEGKLW